MSEKQKIHFVGIGGAGMSAIAKVLLELGYPVSGSDLHLSETTKRLENMGARIFLGHHDENIDHQVGTVVVSSAIPKHNKEVVKAKILDIPVIQRAQMLAALMNRQKGIAVAGAHGKTTTSSMISLVFEKNEMDPTVIVGGELNDIGGNAKLGQGEYLVAEADESDGSFLKLHPHITVVTNIEDDHLDFYGTRENIISAFQEFILETDPEGFTVLCLDDPVSQGLLPLLQTKKRVITYGFRTDADFNARDVRLNGLLTKAAIYNKDILLGELNLSIPGRHNVLNALAAIAVSINCGLSFPAIADSLQTFRGVMRRFQDIGECSGVHIFDDYAHHPTELKATLAAARTLNYERIVAVFQPHRYTRTHLLAREFGEAFRDADILILDEIYAAGESPIPGVSTGLIVEEIRRQTGQPVEYIPDRAEIEDRLLGIIQPGDLLITLGAGNICSVGTDLLQRLKAQQ